MKDKKVSSQYTQQLLANERTYLAWIRTSVAIAGIGFLVTNLHFVMGDLNTEELDVFIMIIGLVSVLSGVLMVIVSTVDYYRKNRDIVNGQIRPSSIKVWILSTCIFIMLGTFLVYFLLLDVI
ncbi:YidH family protein [Jeotgalibacillus proteolyticus]|uniref:YidH family protein n=1 Tax=Jeotgalibacillus proteolyticus TaxID=2082395 RepID=UPI003CF58650